MLDVCLLGTGGMMPLPYRWLTSLMMRYNGKSILIDCGEGTQIAMREKGWSPNPIDIICFTHFHADHISGLPGMLLTMGNAERTEPLLLIGPRGLTKVVASLRVIAPELPFEVKCIEITENAQTFSFEGFRLEAFRVNHNVLCYGYSMVIDRAGRFDKDRAMEQEIPMKFWSRLQKGETLEENGRVFTPDMVLGAERKGLKVTYSTDTRPTESIRQNSKGSDLLILEGMYGEPDKLVKAREHKHMTMYEAAKIAKEAEVPKLWLTHYSPSMTRPEEFMEDVRKIFPATYAAKDGWTMELKFDEKLDIIGNEYDIPLEENFRKDMSTMCNLSQGVKEEGIAIGRREGLEITHIVCSGGWHGTHSPSLLRRRDGSAVSYLQQLACDPYDHEPGILRADAGFLLLFYEAVKSIPRTYSVKLLPAAAAFFRDHDDAYADGQYLHVPCDPGAVVLRYVSAVVQRRILRKT